MLETASNQYSIHYALHSFFLTTNCIGYKIQLSSALAITCPTNNRRDQLQKPHYNLYWPLATIDQQLHTGFELDDRSQVVSLTD